MTPGFTMHPNAKADPFATMPMRMQKLKRHQIMGMNAPVPWFVTWLDANGEPTTYGEGTPDFRIADVRKIPLAIKNRLCWVCGEKLGNYMAFVIGPMCSINRISAEPPCHHDCAIFSATACPFLTRPRMRRNTKDLPEEHQQPAGIMIERNPGVTAVWITKDYRLAKHDQGVLFKIGEPTNIFWFAQGRTATRAEVQASIDSGYPILLDMALEESSEAVAELAKQHQRAMQYLPVDKGGKDGTATQSV